MTTDFWSTPDDDFTPWSLADIYADLAGLSEICQGLDVGRSRVRRWIERGERIRCPQPLRRIGNADIYSMQEWQLWYQGWLDPARRGRRRDSRWVDTQPAGKGESFFTYSLTCPTCGHRELLK